eukprot:TRINITY_DN28625_c0_g1_i1.p2 TRINITY_DN28625_c0_g1~~TRINITY_DN28625_c0_g1_i1.p2  ORF type:complete len:145 (-),score=28.52 TRINITY_DN28625_c0_g1_i1:63-437(-)
MCIRDSFIVSAQTFLKATDLAWVRLNEQFSFERLESSKTKCLSSPMKRNSMDLVDLKVDANKRASLRLPKGDSSVPVHDVEQLLKELVIYRVAEFGDGDWGEENTCLMLRTKGVRSRIRFMLSN